MADLSQFGSSSLYSFHIMWHPSSCGLLTFGDMQHPSCAGVGWKCASALYMGGQLSTIDYRMSGFPALTGLTRSSTE